MFDSGFGGLTVARAVIDLLPGEDLVYIGDTGRYPYGPKPPDDIRRYAAQLAWSLVKEHDVKALIVACNTAAVVRPRRPAGVAAGPGDRRRRPRRVRRSSRRRHPDGSG